MGVTNFDVVQANNFIGGGVSAPVPVSPFAQVWYVDGTNGSNTSNGKSPIDAFATIAQAVSASTSGRGDHIVIAPGTYLHTSALVPVAANVFRAAVQGRRAPTVTISGNIADVVQVDVEDVVFQGIEFLATGSTADNLVDVGDTATADGLAFLDCVFNGADQTSVIGIQMNDTTWNASGLTVKGCLFRDLTGTHLNVGAIGMAYADISYNQFAIDVNSGTAIALADTGAFATGKGYVIDHNDFTGFDASKDEVAITVSGTEDTTGAGMIRDNYFAYLAAAAITIDKVGFATIQNYYGDDTGGLLVDVGT